MSHLSSRDPREFIVAKYYRARGDNLALPNDFRSREFAFQLFNMKSYIRHLSFNSKEELIRWITIKHPHSAFYSSAIYEIPDAPNMKEKGWNGAELQLDIDVDHLEECREEIYNPCRDSSIDVELFQEDCLRIGFEKAYEAKNVLERDLGLKHTEIHFSGNRGFHVLVRDHSILFLEGDERRELADYLNATGLSLNIILPRRRGLITQVPSPEEPGWRGRLARWAVKLYKKEKTDTSFEEFFWSNLEKIIQYASIETDAQVTIDTTRLIRIPGSINGKSGLLVTTVQKEPGEEIYLDEFSPFKGTIKIAPLCNMKVSFGGRKFVFSKNITYKVEGSIGVFLFFKGLARLVYSGDLIV
jgi:DNA primase small subunit